MGRLMNQPPPAAAAAPAPAPEIHHFSHPHTLQFSNHQPGSHVSCSGCKLALSGGIYGCMPCNYFLHISCAQMPQQITHPFDPNGHVLFLLPKPIYPEGAFGCDACGKQGSGFSYHCSDCGIDLHINCAAMPLLHTHHSHLHKLDLAFSPPYHNKSFSCDICKMVGSNHWLYRCSSCEFDAHLECATTKAAAAPIQAPVQQHQMQQIQAVPRATIPQYYPNPGTQFVTRPPLQSSPSGNFANNPNPAVNGPVRPNGNSLGNALLYQTVGGLVNGASQAIGQNFMQGLLGGGSGGGGGGGGGFNLNIPGADTGGGGGGGGGGGFNLNIPGADTGGGGGGGGGDGGYMVINDNGMEGSTVDTQDCNY